MATYKDCVHFAVCDRCPDCKPDECEFFISENGADELKHSEWKLYADGSGKCKRCGRIQKHVWDVNGWQNFCGHCGAKMDGRSEK